MHSSNSSDFFTIKVLRYTVFCNYLHSGKNRWASVFSGSRITWIRYFKTVRRLSSIFAYISMCMCLSILYLWYTTTYRYISTSRARSIYSLQHFSHGSGPMQSWLMSSSPPLQYENLYWRPESIMLTQRATQLAIPPLKCSVARPLFRAGRCHLPCTKIAV